MRRSKDVRSLRREVGKKYTKFNLCQSLGTLGYLKEDETDIAKQLGPGVTIYFKMLKFLTIMFSVFTLLSAGPFILCFTHQDNTRYESSPHILV